MNVILVRINGSNLEKEIISFSNYAACVQS